MRISEDLVAAGISVQDGYLDPLRVAQLLGCLHARRSRGDFAAARIGRDGTLQHDATIRADLTCWMMEPCFAAERQLLREFEQLRLKLNQDLYLGLFELELHYAWYPPGAFYARHVDQSLDTDARRVSIILYLNEDWGSGTGGELELYDAEGGSRRLDPLGGRLVCFLSAGREHAVLAARRDRYSVTGWFRTR